MSSGRASNLNSPSSSLPVTANTPAATTTASAIPSAAGKPSEPIAASHLKHNILAWDTTPLHTGASDTGRSALSTLGTSPTNLRGTLLREGIFPTEPNSAAIAPTSANVSNTSLSNTNNTNVEASSGGSYGYSSRLTSSAAAQHRRASHMTLVRQPHPTSSAVHGANAGLNSPSTLPATATNTNTVTTNTNADTPAATTTVVDTAVEDELAATGLSFEVEHPSSSHTEDKSHTTHNSNEDDIDGCCTAEAKKPHGTKTKAEAATTATTTTVEEEDNNNSAAPQPSPQPVPIARHSPPAEAAAPQTYTNTNTNTTPATAPTPTIVSANTTHPYCNYFKPPIEPGRQRWLLSFNASSPSNNSIANGGGALLGSNTAGGVGGVNGANMNNAMRGLDANGECGGAAWRQSSDTLQGWAEMCTGGCTLRKNATGSHLLFITEEYTVAEEPLMAMSCANCVLLRAAVCLPRGKSEACFSAQAQYRYVMYNAGPPTTTGTATTPNARERGTTGAATPLVYVGLGLTPRLNEELKGGFYLVLAQLNNDGAASVSIGLWRVTERDTIEQQRILHPPQTVRLAHDKLTLRLVIREGEFDVYANDATALHSAVAAPGLKLGESYALLLNTGGPVSVRHIALAEGERPPESRVFQFYTNSPTATPATVPNTTTQGTTSPATQLNSPHKATNMKHSPPPRGRNSPPSLQQQQQQVMSSRANAAGSGGRDRTSRNNSPPVGAINSSSNSPSQQQQSQPQSPHSGPYHHSASQQQQHSSLNSPNKTTASTGTTGRQTRGGNVSGRNSPPSGNATETNAATGNVPPAPLPPAMTSPYANNTNTNTNTNAARPTRRGNYAGQTGTTNSGRPSRPGTGNGRTNAHGTRRNTNGATTEGDDAAEGLPPNVDPQLAAAIQAEIMERVPQVAWDDIAGLADGKRLLKEAVLLPLLLPELFVGVVQPWRGVLLFGPPGTGKTMLAKAVATSAKTTFFNISASTLNNKHYGESEKLVRTLFELARHYAPSTIFFDEVDALVSQRSCTEHEASRRVKSEMLQQMDGLHATNTTGGNSEGRVLVLATTNRPWDLDEAIRRRLEKRIYIPLPDEAGRRALLEKHMAHLNLGPDVDVEAIVKATEHFSGADIAVIVRDAAMMPVRRLIDTYTTEEIAAKKAAGELEVTAVNMEDFRSALSRAAPSVSKESLERFATWAATYGST